MKSCACAVCQRTPQTHPTPRPVFGIGLPWGDRDGSRSTLATVGFLQHWPLSLVRFPLQARKVSFLPWAACKVSQARAGAKAPGCQFQQEAGLLDGACNSIHPQYQMLEILDQNISTAIYSGQRPFPLAKGVSHFMVSTDGERGMEGR